MCWKPLLNANGPAIPLTLVWLRAAAQSRYFSQKIVTVQGRYGVVFAVRYIFCELYECRGTMPIENRLVITLLLFY